MSLSLTLPYCTSQFCFKYPFAGFLFVLLVLILFIIINRTFVKFPTEEEKIGYAKRTRKLKNFVFLTKTLVFLLLTIALTSPYTTRSIVIPGEPGVTIFSDNSTSFSLFQDNIAEDLRIKLSEKLPTKIRYMGYGEKSAIGDSILNNVQNDENILLVTDGQNNYGHDLGDIILYVSQLNTTVSNLDISPIKKDVGVSIEGPYEIILGAEPIFRINVQNTGDVKGYRLKVTIDGKAILDKEDAATQTFAINPELGFHKLIATVEANDNFPQNNIFYKTVKVVPKPNLLYVSEKASPLLRGLKGIYNVDEKNTIPKDLSAYDTVILNNVPEKIVHENIVKISDYVTEGNGLVVIGGENSFDHGEYKDSLFETILPVNVGSGTIIEDTTNNVVVVMDISDSGVIYKFSGSSEQTVLDVNRGLAVKILENFRQNISIGFVVFAKFANVLAPIKKLSDQGDLIAKVKSLRNGMGTNIADGLRRAQFLLDQVSGSKNIILISDGIDKNEVGIKQEVAKLSTLGYRIYTVGVGEHTNRKLMQEMAAMGNGQYFEPAESQYLNVLFGNPESSDKVFAGSSNLVVFDKNHFITKDLIITSRITGVNFVVPKPAARQLIVSNEKHPVLAVWRFGLGRIASLSTDDGSKWSSSLLTNENSRLITRTINWAIGDLTRKKQFDVQIKDTTLGKTTQINVLSHELPKYEGISFARIDPKIYTATYIPENTGFQEILETPFAVNYNDEYLKLGMNPELDQLVALSGGATFDPNDTDKMIEVIKSFSKRVKTETVNYRWILILAALIIILVEIVIRRINENEKIFN